MLMNFCAFEEPAIKRAFETIMQMGLFLFEQ